MTTGETRTRICKKCGDVLVIGHNWSDIRVKQRYYYCRPCDSTRTLKYAGRNSRRIFAADPITGKSVYVGMRPKDAPYPVRTIEPDYSPYIPDQREARRRISITTERPGQSKFRSALLKRDKGCVITGCKNKTMLDAAHVKPFSMCSGPEEYNDLDNGLILRADLHKAFDKAHFTINDDGSIRVRPGVTDVPRGVLVHGLTPGQRRYLEGHRKWFGVPRRSHK